MTNDFLAQPIRLETSRAWRTYLGGSMISALHGETASDDHFPEEWLMSAVTARNAGREHIVEGVSRVAGTDLNLWELMQNHPQSLLGAAHTAKYGKNPGVLVKLLDAAERLTLQVHPTKECAQRLFGSPFGKTECWHIIGKRNINGEEPCLYLGFREGITREHWVSCFERQDIPAMLDCLHRIPVEVGETYMIRAGVPHGIGAGCFLVEIQEPTDYTIRTERVTPSGFQVADFMCHQGLGFPTMFDCFNYEGASLEETLGKYRIPPITEEYGTHTVTQIIYPEITDLFRLEMLTVQEKVTLPVTQFFGIYVLSGAGKLGELPLKKCDHFFIPDACQSITLEANPHTPLTIIRCFGPQ